MEFFKGLDPDLVSWVIIPVLIFLARLVDVSLGTLRIVFVSKGNKNLAPLLGFVEVLIWLVAIGQVMQNLDNFVSYLAWAGGFAVGNFIGLRIEEKLAIGQMVVRVITVEPATELIENLKGKGYRLTCVDAYGTRGKVNLLFMIIRRRDLDYIRGLIRLYNPNAFYSIEDVRAVSDPNIPTTETLKSDRWQLFFPLRKGK
ncbi:DUF2179 domain-containing protein [soil metagenome]